MSFYYSFKKKYAFRNTPKISQNTPKDQNVEWTEDFYIAWGGEKNDFHANLRLKVLIGRFYGPRS